jgi:hypothetical protein
VLSLCIAGTKRFRACFFSLTRVPTTKFQNNFVVLCALVSALVCLVLGAFSQLAGCALACLPVRLPSSRLFAPRARIKSGATLAKTKF